MIRAFINCIVLQAIIACAATRVAQADTVVPDERHSFLPVVDNPFALSPSTSCGPRCATFVDGILGNRSTYEAISQKCKVTAQGCSLDNIKSALEGLGYSTLPLTLDCHNVRCVPLPAIVHTPKSSPNGHFIVLAAYDKETGRFISYNPPGVLEEVSVEQIALNCSGVMLSVSSSPIGRPVGCAASVMSRSSWVYLLIVQLSVLTAATWRQLVSVVKNALSLVSSRKNWLVVALSVVLASCQQEGDPQLSDSDHESNNSYARVANKGVVEAGAAIKHTFRLRNASGRTFQILDVKKACNCQIVNAPLRKAIGINEDFAIEVSFTGGRHDGTAFEKFTLVTDSEDVEHNRIDLRVEYFINRPLISIPGQIMLGDFVEGANVSRRFVVRANRSEEIGGQLKCSSSTANIRLREIERRENEVEFEVEPNANLPIGDIASTLTFTLKDGEDGATCVVPVVGRKCPHLKVTPASIKLSDARDEEIRVVVSGIGKEDVFEVVKVEKPDCVKVAWNSDVKLHRFAVVTVASVGDIRCKNESEIVLHTSHPIVRTVKIPIIR